MYYSKTIIYLSAFLVGLTVNFFLSCNNLTKSKEVVQKSNLPDLEILYLKGAIETQKTVYCSDMVNASSIIIDTIINSKQAYTEITNQVRLLKSKSDSSLSCDVRIKCKLKYSNGNFTDLCIGKLDCILQDGFVMVSNDTLIYLIRKYSGYYNYFSKDELQYFKELKQFKIPEEYKCLLRPNNSNGVPLPPE